MNVLAISSAEPLDGRRCRQSRRARWTELAPREAELAARLPRPSELLLLPGSAPNALLACLDLADEGGQVREEAEERLPERVEANFCFIAGHH